MRYAVVACGACRKPWAVDRTQGTAACPACAAKASLVDRVPLWCGDSPLEAQAAASALRLPAGAGPALQALRKRPAKTLPRHDSPVEAAAAQGAGIVARSARAEAVAAALSRLEGEARHADLVCALEKAGLDAQRAEAEVVRLLAADLLMEPRPGHYRWIGD